MADSSCCVELIQVTDGTTLFLTSGQGGGVGGGGTPLHLAYWRTSGALGSTGGATWDEDNGELTISGPGSDYATLHVVVTDAGGWAVVAETTHATGNGLESDVTAGTALRGNATTGKGVRGVVTTGQAFYGEASGSGGTAAYIAAQHTGATGAHILTQSGATAPALDVQEGATVWQQLLGASGVVLAGAALATNATKGFTYIPTCAGTPTGTPVAHSGTAPFVYDTTNDLLYFYSGGTWLDISGGGGSSPSFADSEVPSGTINGSNVTFTLANTPTAGSVHLYRNTARQTPTADYSISGSTITMVVAPLTGDVLISDYRY